MKLPPLPKWNAAIDDIDTSQTLALAQQHEKSLLPSNITFPRTGQIWEAVRDCQVHFVVSFTSNALEELVWLPGQCQPQAVALVPTFGRAPLAKGEKVRVVFADADRPLSVWFQPLRYYELHESIVPANVRSAPHYSHYRLTLLTAQTQTSRWLQHETEYFTKAFRLVGDVA
jgi:hypothetical protein